MSVNVYDPINDELIPVAGATLYADTPIGVIQAFDAEEVPDGWLIFNGQTKNRADYPDLWARANRNGQVGVGKFYGIGDGSTTFTLADLRETSLKGYGETSRSVGAHVKSGGLGIGEFIDDQIQNHTHANEHIQEGTGNNYGHVDGGNWNFKAMTTYGISGARTGTTTEVKAVGVVWAVKAKMTGLPIDLKEQVEKVTTITGSTTEGGGSYILKKVGKVVTLRVSGMQIGLVRRDITVLTIPAGFRPSYRMIVTGFYGIGSIDNEDMVGYTIDTSGVVSTYPYEQFTNTNPQLCATWIID